LNAREGDAAFSQLGVRSRARDFSAIVAWSNDSNSNGFFGSVFVRMLFMGPSHEEVVAIATDLIARFGANAHEEALHLVEVAVAMRAVRNRKLFSRAAREIEKSFVEARVRMKTTPVSEAAE
jgi:hypothetical protein